MDKTTIVVSDEHVGLRLDKFLSEMIAELTRVRLQDLINNGCVLKGDLVATSCSYKVKLGEQFHLTIPQLQEAKILPENIAIDVVYEDEHLLVINKAAGMVVHPAAGCYSGTLVNALLHHCAGSLSGIGGVMRPGIVHRLDKDTSGLMMVAKHDIAHNGLSAQLQDRSLKRTYHAFSWGMIRPDSGVINKPIARSPYDRKKMAIVEGGKPAITEYNSLRRFCANGEGAAKIMFASQIECNLQTGRTHQIRVHLSAANCGIIGDSIYTPNANRKLAMLRELDDELSECLQNFPRQALHATQIRFIHPISGEAMQFSCNYPEDMQYLNDTLEKTL